MALAFLDTNVLLRHLRQDDATLGAKATAIIRRIEGGELQCRTTDTVVFEVVFTLHRTYKLSPERIAAHLLPVLDLPGILLPGKSIYREVFALFTSRGAGFADCYHAALMHRLGITEILSFDTDFDKFPSIRRRED
jgi:predicted nucleic acid-binding protein